jgi:hypothetical protein
MFKQIFVVTLASLFGSTSFASIPRHHHHVPMHHLKVYHGHPSSWAPLFPPTHESLLAQNVEIDRLGLPRIKNDRELNALVANGDLVPLPVGVHLIVDKHLPANRRFCRPWTAQFLTDLSDAFYEKFHEPVMVDSAVRTVEVQKKLRRWNGNAAPAEGDTASSHLAGLTVDLARRRMSKEQAQFVEQWLMPLYTRKLVEVEEEYRQFCFHIMVSGEYGKFIDTIPLDSTDVAMELLPLKN